MGNYDQMAAAVSELSGKKMWYYWMTSECHQFM